MFQPLDPAVRHVAMFLSPVGQRRVDFQKHCGEQFAQLYLADGTEQAGALLAREPLDLMVIDLERFERGLDLSTLGRLVASRKGAATLVICPFASASWLPALMAYGELDYLIGPVAEAQLRAAVEARLASTAVPAAPPELSLRPLLALRSRLQDTLVRIDDLNKVAEQVCRGLCDFPGVVHAAVFDLQGTELQLAAQHSVRGIDLVRLLQRGDRLLQSPLRHVFPGLLAACSGDIAFLDAPEKAEEPELASGLRQMGIEMVLGVPIAATGAGTARGALCLMFERQRRFGREDFDTLLSLAQLAGFAMRMAEMERDSEQLQARLTYLATVDPLTGVANRRHGEAMLEQEIRRARRYKLPLALIAFDIDRFQDINDRFGYACGDGALRTVADLTQASMRTPDRLVRSGGVEFQIIAPHTSAIDGLKMAEKLRQAIAQSDIPGCDRLTISLGVGQFGEQETGEALMLRVSAALARAKRAGRNCVELAMQ